MLDSTSAQNGTHSNSYKPELVELTSRERSVVLLASKDYSSKEIATHLGIAEETVKKHRKNIIHKCGFSGKRAFQKIIRYFSEK